MSDTKTIKDLFKKTTIKDVMSEAKYTIQVTAELSWAEKLFTIHHITHLPVVDLDDKLVGLISHKYLYKTHSPRKMMNNDVDLNPDMIVDGDSFYNRASLNQYILKHMMHKDPFTMKKESSLEEALLNMSKKKIGCICVVDANRNLEGILTDREIVAFIVKQISA